MIWLWRSNPPDPTGSRTQPEYAVHPVKHDAAQMGHCLSAPDQYQIYRR
ncbi:Uncharacterised protein [Vibrio cholerae]|nr:Uncharacterised protein [Vibrio cholerae]CSI71813.1 Uncharacterised protein [Vibrio cholerae]